MEAAFPHRPLEAQPSIRRLGDHSSETI